MQPQYKSITQRVHSLFAVGGEKDRAIMITHFCMAWIAIGGIDWGQHIGFSMSESGDAFAWD